MYLLRVSNSEINKEKFTYLKMYPVLSKYNVRYEIVNDQGVSSYAAGDSIDHWLKVSDEDHARMLSFVSTSECHAHSDQPQLFRNYYKLYWENYEGGYHVINDTDVNLMYPHIMTTNIPTEKANAMNTVNAPSNIVKIETCVLITDTKGQQIRADQLSVDQLVDLIRIQEDLVAGLSGIKAKSNAIEKLREKHQGHIKALVDVLDALI